MLEIPDHHPQPTCCNFLLKRLPSLFILTSLLGYKYLVMKEKEGKGAKCGEIRKADSQKHHPKNYLPPNQSTAQSWAKAPTETRGRKHSKEG